MLQKIWRGGQGRKAAERGKAGKGKGGKKKKVHRLHTLHPLLRLRVTVPFPFLAHALLLHARLALAVNLNAFTDGTPYTHACMYVLHDVVYMLRTCMCGGGACVLCVLWCVVHVVCVHVMCVHVVCAHVVCVDVVSMHLVSIHAVITCTNNLHAPSNTMLAHLHLYVVSFHDSGIICAELAHTIVSKQSVGNRFT